MLPYVSTVDYSYSFKATPIEMQPRVEEPAKSVITWTPDVSPAMRTAHNTVANAIFPKTGKQTYKQRLHRYMIFNILFYLAIAEGALGTAIAGVMLSKPTQFYTSTFIFLAASSMLSTIFLDMKRKIFNGGK